jgi:6-phosphogluconolactonase
MMEWEKQIHAYDSRRDLVIPGDAKETLLFCAEQFIQIGNAAIQEKGKFNVALSGGSTPKALFQLLASPLFNTRLPWEHVILFWSDERNVPPDSPDSNYKMAMDSGFSLLPVPKENIHRMPAEGLEIVVAAKTYEQLILDLVPKASFDLVMLGMGEDGHTASLFPKTHGLHAEGSLVVANFLPDKNVWRMTLTFECINAAQHISLYVIGKSKSPMVKEAFSNHYDANEIPVERIGTRTHKALWILDKEAASLLPSPQNLGSVHE